MSEMPETLRVRGCASCGGMEMGARRPIGLRYRHTPHVRSKAMGSGCMLPGTNARYLSTEHGVGRAEADSGAYY
eukprot:2260221-Rhodomonas_salina.1